MHICLLFGSNKIQKIAGVNMKVKLYLHDSARCTTGYTTGCMNSACLIHASWHPAIHNQLFSWLHHVCRHQSGCGTGWNNKRVPWKVMGSHRILEDHFRGLESYRKQQRWWKVLENDDNVRLFTTEAEAAGAQEQQMKSCWICGNYNHIIYHIIFAM